MFQPQRLGPAAIAALVASACPHHEEPQGHVDGAEGEGSGTAAASDDLVPNDIARATGLEDVQCVFTDDDRYALRLDALQAGALMPSYNQAFVLECAALCASREQLANAAAMGSNPTTAQIARGRYLEAKSQRLATEAKVVVQQAAMKCRELTPTPSTGGPGRASDPCLEHVMKAIATAQRCLTGPGSAGGGHATASSASPAETERTITAPNGEGEELQVAASDEVVKSAKDKFASHSMTSLDCTSPAEAEQGFVGPQAFRSGKLLVVHLRPPLMSPEGKTGDVYFDATGDLRFVHMSDGPGHQHKIWVAPSGKRIKETDEGYGSAPWPEDALSVARDVAAGRKRCVEQRER